MTDSAMGMTWGDKGCERRPDKCDHAPNDGCEWCCMHCNTDMHRCGGCGTPTDHKETICPDCEPELLAEHAERQTDIGV